MRTLFLMFFFTSTCYAENFEIKVPLADKGLVTYYVQGQIDGFGKTEFMVDTGSGYTTINQHTLKRLKSSAKAVYVKDLIGTMANGREQIFPVYKITQLDIGSNCSLEDVEVAILPGQTRNILGMNVLKLTAPFAISTNPPQLYLSKCTSRV